MHSFTRIAALLLVAAASGRAAAQDIEVLTRRVETLGRAAAEARARLTAHDDSVRRVATRLDTVHAAAPTIMAEAPLIPSVQRVLPSIMETLAAEVGSATGRMAGYAITLRLDAPASDQPTSVDSPRLNLTMATPERMEMQGWRAPPDSLGALLRDGLRYIVYAATDPSFHQWMGRAVPTDTVHTSEWARHRLLLVSSPASVGLRCYQGDLDACEQALRLAAVSDPIMEWHDAPSRRSLVVARMDEARRVNPRLATACEGGSDSSCVLLLRQLRPPVVLDPVHPLVRLGLVRYAIARGGPGAVERLLAGNTIQERIAAAAGVPFRDVLRGWRERIHNARMPSGDLSAEILLVSLAWAVGFGLLSVRSSRWR